MSLTFTGSTGLFTILGKAIYAAKINNTNRSESAADKVPKEMLDAIVQFGNLTPTKFLSGLPAILTSGTQDYQSGCTSASQAVKAFCQQLLIELVRADSPRPNLTLRDAVQYLVDQMDAQSASVEDTVVSHDDPSIDHYGTGDLRISMLRADGRSADFAFDEVIRLTCVGAGSGLYPTSTWQAEGEFAETDRLSQYWPRGSGCRAALTSSQANSGNNELTNGGFDTEADVAGDDTGDDFPEGWTVVTGTLGTTLKLSNAEVQTITITGTPTAGHYQINWTNLDLIAQVTAPIPYDASASDVQGYLQALKGLEQVTVTSTGTSPNYVHTITFLGVPGNQTAVTITNRTTSGSFAVATTVHGEAAYIGRSLIFDGNASELTKIIQPVSLKPLTQYSLTFRNYLDVDAAAGILRLRLVDAVSGTTIQDEAGSDNAKVVNIGSMGAATWSLDGEFFRTPRVLPAVVYFEIGLTTALSNTSSYFLDEVRLVEVNELYRGGPSFDINEGYYPFAVGDRLDVDIINERDSLWQEWFYRIFEPDKMPQRGGGGCLMLPVVSSGETIADSLIG